MRPQRDVGVGRAEDDQRRTGRTMDEIAAGKTVWHSEAGANGDKPAPKRVDSRSHEGGRPARAGDAEKTLAQKLRRKASGVRTPQLATLVDAPPAGDDWLHEIKYDGYRAIASIAGGKVAIYTRNGLDWTDKFHALVAGAAELPVRQRAARRRDRGGRRRRATPISARCRTR